MAATTTTVKVPIELLTEAAGFLDGLDTIASRLGIELPGSTGGIGRAMEISSSLTMCDPSYSVLWDDSDEKNDAQLDREIDAHPLIVGITEHSEKVVAAFERQYLTEGERDTMDEAMRLLTSMQQRVAAIVPRLDALEARTTAAEAKVPA